MNDICIPGGWPRLQVFKNKGMDTFVYGGNNLKEERKEKSIKLS